MSIDNKQRTLANIIELIITILDHLIPMYFIILRRKKKMLNIQIKYFIKVNIKQMNQYSNNKINKIG